jgi:hypothetical protein
LEVEFMLEQSPVDDDSASEQVTDEGPSTAATPAPAETGRKVVFVAGSGRSGTSLMSGILKHLGLHVPEPEVAADGTNPKGFGEPQWVVDFHDTILGRINVHPGDARPSAWFDAGRACTREHNRSRLTEWLNGQFEVSSSLVIKDPRLPWFLGLWRVASVRTSAATSTITMLRPPPEVVGSKNAYYGGRLGDISRLAGWTNVMLCTERATRDTARAFVQYHDLLSDWTKTVVRIGEELEIDEIANAGTRQMQEVHSFVDPRLHRVRADWDDLTVPDGLREIAVETWQQLSQLAEPGGDTLDVHRRLDELREAYGSLYAEAEALTSSSIAAAGPEYFRVTTRERQAQAEAERAAAYAAAGPARKGYLRTRRLAGRVKRRLDGGA